MPKSRVQLSSTTNGAYHPGRGFLMRAAWLVMEALILLNPLMTSYGAKTKLLRLFGARVGEGLVIKPNVHIKYPWRLTVGDHVWLGERAWIDNLADVTIGSNVCISQGAYLCTGNHDRKVSNMPLVVGEVRVSDGAWVGAFSKIAPNVTIGVDAIVSLGSVLTQDAQPGRIYQGNPAVDVGPRGLLHEVDLVTQNA